MIKNDAKINNNIKLSFNIITIGDCGVGKTSIFRRFIYNTFEYNCSSTVGLNILIKDVELSDGTIIQLKLTDTAGQERFRSLSKTYFKNADGVLFVFSLNDLGSFKNIQGWMEIFKNNSFSNEDIPIYLLGNKSDLKKQVNDDLIETFIKNNKCKYKSISAFMNENDEISELFTEIATTLYEKYERRSTRNNSQYSMKLLSLKSIRQQKKKKFLCCK